MSGHRHNDCHDHSHGFLSRLRGHSHEIEANTMEDLRRLKVCIATNGIYGILQFLIGFIMLGSMILATDAIHNASDMFSLGLSLAVVVLNGRRMTLSTSLIWLNYLLLIAFLALAISESVLRIATPENALGELTESTTIPVIGDVNIGIIMAILAGVGIGVNTYSVIVLNKGKNSSSNLRAAFLHQLFDLVVSVIAVIASLGIAMTGWSKIDPILTVIASALLWWMVWPHFRESWADLSSKLFSKGRRLHA